MGKIFVSPMNSRSPSTETVGVAIGAVCAVDGADDGLAGCGCTGTAREAGLSDDGRGCAKDEVEGAIVNNTLSVDGTDSSSACPPAARFSCAVASAAESLSSP